MALRASCLGVSVVHYWGRTDACISGGLVVYELDALWLREQAEEGDAMMQRRCTQRGQCVDDLPSLVRKKPGISYPDGGQRK